MADDLSQAASAAEKDSVDSTLDKLTKEAKKTIPAPQKTGGGTDAAPLTATSAMAAVKDFVGDTKILRNVAPPVVGGIVGGTAGITTVLGAGIGRAGKAIPEAFGEKDMDISTILYSILGITALKGAWDGYKSGKGILDTPWKAIKGAISGPMPFAIILGGIGLFCGIRDGEQQRMEGYSANAVGHTRAVTGQHRD
jgi:hypothetical protein